MTTHSWNGFSDRRPATGVPPTLPLAVRRPHHRATLCHQRGETVTTTADSTFSTASHPHRQRLRTDRGSALAWCWPWHHIPTDIISALFDALTFYIRRPSTDTGDVFAFIFVPHWHTNFTCITSSPAISPQQQFLYADT